MSDDPQSLSGVWYGRYAAATHHETNSFIAVIDDRGGAVSGIITEPDDSGSSDIRRAFVSGTRSGGTLDFIKQYDGAVEAHAVRYSGVVNDDATGIKGDWKIDWGAETFAGSFMMEREKFSVEELEDEEEVGLFEASGR